jgi:hypothetical protein
VRLVRVGSAQHGITVLFDVMMRQQHL